MKHKEVFLIKKKWSKLCTVRSQNKTGHITSLQKGALHAVHWLEDAGMKRRQLSMFDWLFDRLQV